MTWIVSITVNTADPRVSRCQTELAARQLAEKWSRDLNYEVDISEVKATCVRKVEWLAERPRKTTANYGGVKP